jgi:hypothetical protein
MCPCNTVHATLALIPYDIQPSNRAYPREYLSRKPKIMVETIFLRQDAYAPMSVEQEYEFGSKQKITSKISNGTRKHKIPNTQLYTFDPFERLGDGLQTLAAISRTESHTQFEASMGMCVRRLCAVFRQVDSFDQEENERIEETCRQIKNDLFLRPAIRDPIERTIEIKSSSESTVILYSKSFESSENDSIELCVDTVCDSTSIRTRNYGSEIRDRQRGYLSRIKSRFAQESVKVSFRKKRDSIEIAIHGVSPTKNIVSRVCELVEYNH